MPTRKNFDESKHQQILKLIHQAIREGWSKVDLSNRGVFHLPEEIGQLTGLRALYLYNSHLSYLPESFKELASLEALDLGINKFAKLPGGILLLQNLRSLLLYSNQLIELPESINQLTKLHTLDLNDNQLTALPESLGSLSDLHDLNVSYNRLTALPESLAGLTNLQRLDLSSNQLTGLPGWIASLPKLRSLYLEDNPLNPALQSAYESGLDAVKSYLRSLQADDQRELLYEAKLVLVGEGKVGKTTLLKALTGKEPQKDEKTTRGVSIEVLALPLPHPEKPGVNIQFNSWDFGGQETYRVTHQFFFSRRSVYLLVWEPRLGVQQCQVEDWLKMIRLRVGEDARVIIVSTHCRTDERIARIDKEVFKERFPMIVDFLEVDSLKPDPQTGEMVGVAELKTLIAKTAADLEQMGMPFNRDWRAARDEVLALGKPRITYAEFVTVCAARGLDEIATKTLADLMHDLGYIVFYSDDERLKDDLVLQPEWLTKAISYVLEDQATQNQEGILEDQRLKTVWHDHAHDGEPRYPSSLYPFFLRLMEKYDVLYRLETGDASLVAQHVPQVRPPLPWLPENEPTSNNKRISLVCRMEENPPGLIPWMIVRTHHYASTVPDGDGKAHRLHWQKGMFLNYKGHTSAMLELRNSELYIFVQAPWPKKFISILRETLQKLIDVNWRGLKNRYQFVIPCPGKKRGVPCSGDFPIDYLHHMLEEMGYSKVPCQQCFQPQDVESLLYGFENEDERYELLQLQLTVERVIEEIKTAVVEQSQALGEDLTKIADKVDYYFMAMMRAIAAEAKFGPRLFTLEPAGGWQTFLTKPLLTRRYHLRLWCEASDCEHPVVEEGKGLYKVDVTHDWVKRVAPYANFISGVLKTLLPMTAPAIDSFLGEKSVESLGIKAELELMKEGTGRLLPEIRVAEASRLRQDALSEEERSGLLALHDLLRKADPHHERLGLLRVATYTGDYLWLCRKHFDALSKIPDQIP